MIPRKLIASMALAVPLLAQAQIPTTDILTQIQLGLKYAADAVQAAIVNGADAEKIAQLKATYAQLVQTGQQIAATYQNFTGNRGMGSLYGISAADRQWMPSTYGGFRSGGTWGSRVDSSASAAAVLTDAALAQLPPTVRAFLVSTRQLSAMARTTSQDAYERASKRFADFQPFITTTCDDMKCEAERANRIAGEKLMMDNERAQAEALDRSMRAEQMTQQASDHEAYLQSIGSVRTRAVVTHEYQP